MSRCAATLTLEFGWVRAFRLADGGLTQDRRTAEQDRHRRIADRQDAVSVAVSALLRLPVTMDGHRSTPARVRSVGALVAAGVLPAAVRGQVATLTAISDPAWQPVSGLCDLIEPEEVEHHCWRFSLLDELGRPLGLPGGYDPLMHSEGTPPRRALRTALAALAADGWQVVSVEAEPDAADWLDPLEDGLLQVLRYRLVRRRPALGRRALRPGHAPV